MRFHRIEVYLRIQLGAVQARIADLENGQADGDTGWTLQLMPSPEGTCRGYLHHASCFIRGRPLAQDQARKLLEMPEITACDACHPDP
ncbi:DUF6233 domain-containing protein [Streptomyces violaceusniger]|uniref:DUF6233 domain-containing protein n=1 Tax=Streptomyces antimycoticus TaxID=68175 RepID=UPI0035308DE1